MHKNVKFSIFNFQFSIFFCIFAADMRKIAFIALCLFCFVCAHAETIVLRTGTRMKGTIVFQNEEVVIVRDAEGARFQFPRTDVEQVLGDDAVETLASQDLENSKEEIKTPKRVTALLEVAFGAAYMPGEKTGLSGSADLLIGSHHIRDRHLFIGGGLGYHGIFLNKTYNFLPVQVALRMPLIEQKHAPLFGVSLGYGVALSKQYVGGLYTGLDLGYRCQLNPKTAIGAVFFARFQQAKVDATEIIEDVEFTHRIGRNFITYGAKLTLYF